MTPKRWTKSGELVTFHYSISDLRKFVEYCYEGCAGPLLWKRSGNIFTYKLSGTLEKPYPVKRMKDLFTMRISHHPIFDGKMKSDDDRCKEPKEEIWMQDHRMVFLDMGEDKKKPTTYKSL